MHICRSALCCCVISSLSYNIIKKYCVPRDLPEGREDASSSINVEDNVLSERSGITTDEEDLDDRDDTDSLALNEAVMLDVDE